MAINKNNGTIVSGKISLTNGTLSGTILPAAPAGQRYYIYDIIITTNDTAQPLITIQDSATSPVQVLKAYVINSSPTLVTSTVATPVSSGASVTASAGAITTGKTVEIRVMALLSF